MSRNSDVLKYAAAGAGALAAAGAAFWLWARGSSPRDGIPSTMRALRLTKFIDQHNMSETKGHFEVVTVPTPVPKAGEILVRIERSPINPADLLFLAGAYNPATRPTLPTPVGMEASGVVVQSGGGVIGRKLLGKRVGCIGAGAWGEYIIAPAAMCLELPNDVSFDEGSCWFVNPMTVASMVDLAQRQKQKAIVHTAAGSALGKMLVKHAQRHGIEIICVVRKHHNKVDLEKVGAKHIIITDTNDRWQEELAAVCKQYNCTLGLDAVSGPFAGQVLKAMPQGSTLHVYGDLSGKPVGEVSTANLIFDDKHLSGFWLSQYFKEVGTLGMLRLRRQVLKYLKTDFKTEIAGSYPLTQIEAAIKDYTSNMSGGKVLIAPQSKH